MRLREIQTAEYFGILDRCKAFEEDLLQIKDIVPDKSEDGVCFDLSGFYSDIPYVIVLPHYDIGMDRSDYWEARKQVKSNVVALAKKHDLYRTEDSIEDQGTHFYFVFHCGKSWMEEYFMKRLDNLEGCEDNPVYADEIKKIRRQLEKIRTE